MPSKKRRLLLAIALPAVIVAAGVHYFQSHETPLEQSQPAPVGRPRPPNYCLIEDGLFVGGRVQTPPPGTRAVLNLCELRDDFEVEAQQWSQFPTAPTIAWLREQVEFIDKQRRAGLPTYVHCLNGVSRSATVVTAYEMWQHGWTRDQALSFVRSKRPEVSPVSLELLLEWEKVVEERGNKN